MLIGNIQSSRWSIASWGGMFYIGASNCAHTTLQIRVQEGLKHAFDLDNSKWLFPLQLKFRIEMDEEKMHSTQDEKRNSLLEQDNWIFV